MPVNLGFISLGCPKNQVDTEVMIARAKASGYRIVNDKNKADIIIVNTCGFLDSAREEAIDNIIECGALKKHGRLQYLLAVGCLPQLHGQELLNELPELDGVAGISALEDIGALLKQLQNGERIARIVDPSSVKLRYAPRVLASSPGSAYLKIADGCNNVCSYCLIPSIRGHYRSKPGNAILREARQLISDGVKELVLVAQDSGLYGSDLGITDGLPAILHEICQLDELQWLRLMYLHPGHISDKLLETVAREEKVVPYLEIPIQHASKAVLKRMNRHYDRDALWQLLARLRRTVPGLILRTTVMTGFPGETEEDFQILMDFIGSAEFDWLGCFVFEAQEGTPAAAWIDNPVPEDLAVKRQEQVMQLQQGITRQKNQARVGRQEKILVEKRISTHLYSGRGFWQAPEIDGLTIIKSDRKLERGQMAEVLLKGIRDYDMIGEYGS